LADAGSAIAGNSGRGREHSALFLVLARLYGNPIGKKSVAIGRLLYTTESWEAKMEIPDTEISQFRRSGAE